MDPGHVLQVLARAEAKGTRKPLRHVTRVRPSGDPASRRCRHPGHHLQQGGFAAAVRAFKPDEPPGGNFLADVADDPRLPQPVPLAHRF
jgi:hypothetical protein